MSSRLRRDKHPLRIGHRGAAALAPDNTLRSFERALEVGVDMIEFDVLDLADGTLVLAHSDDLAEISGGRGTGPIRGRSLEELRAAAPELATLDEALAYLQRHSELLLHLDLKLTGYEEATVAALRRHSLLERALVSTTFPESLRAVAALEPVVERGLTYPYDRLGLGSRRALLPVLAPAVLAMRRALPRRIGSLLERAHATVATLHHSVVSRAVVDRCHAAGAAVVTWTVDDPRLAATLAAAGVDGIVTNDPRIFGDTLKI